MEMPLLGMGTWGMGGKWEKDSSNIKESVEILRAGLDVGIRLIDVAELYGEGMTEEIVGEAIQGYKREEIFIISKVWKIHLRYDDVLKAAEGSLKRLRTDYIDLYLVHWPNEEVPLKETMKAMEYLADKGLAHHIGVSNFSVALMKEAQKYLEHTKLAANEVEYNLIERSVEQDIIPYCRANNIQVIAYRPLAKGKLAEEHNELLRNLAKKYDKTPVQVALNWTMSKGIVAIPRASSVEHLKENYGALGWSLDAEDIESLIKNFIA